VGIAQEIAELTIFSGWEFRTAIYLLVLGSCVWYVMHYAKKVKKKPESSIIFDESESGQVNFTEDVMNFGELKKRHIFILLTFFIGIVINVYVNFQNGWFLTELSANFFLVAIIVGLVKGITVNDIFDAFIEEMKLVVYCGIIVCFS